MAPIPYLFILNKMNKLQPKIGAHVSVAGGLWNAVSNASSIGAECFQIFGSNPRGWHTKFPDKETLGRFKNDLNRAGLGPVYLHASYLPNLANDDKEARKKSIRNLAEHLKISEMIKGRGLIFHLGSGVGSRLERVAEGIKEVLKKVPGKSFLIMENSSGGGNKVGSTAEEVKKIYDLVKDNRVKICIDTAHAFEAGEELESFLKLPGVIVIHANDSKTAFGSKNDRHENIGDGLIGMEEFRKLAKDERLLKMDWLLEVPGYSKTGPDKKAVDILKSCFVIS